MLETPPNYRAGYSPENKWKQFVTLEHDAIFNIVGAYCLFLQHLLMTSRIALTMPTQKAMELSILCHYTLSCACLYIAYRFQ